MLTLKNLIQPLPCKTPTHTCVHVRRVGVSTDMLKKLSFAFGNWKKCVQQLQFHYTLCFVEQKNELKLSTCGQSVMKTAMKTFLVCPLQIQSCLLLSFEVSSSPTSSEGTRLTFPPAGCWLFIQVETAILRAKEQEV